ncbi:MAG TPA: VOC family protein [Candidatus Agrococcus pullicola]|uniref:VOC family protein n=1 Tax=Candidatus Agrococcus pullicola TaxID=2838429 RepID=A0A9D1YSK8_9MICO|nr:VOC family protein [Candidatus Agrococcus pullicola]
MLEETLGPVGHVAFVVPDVREAMRAMAPCGLRWSSVTRPTALMQGAAGTVQEVHVDYVASAGGEPRVKLISAVPGSVFETPERGGIHHLSYWVDDLESATYRLSTQGWSVEATGLESHGAPRFRYLIDTNGSRIELGQTALRQEFDDWADS